MPRGDSELDPSLQDKAVRGILWSGLNNWGEPIISLAAFLVVVRTIGPEAYGLFGMALLVVGLGELLVSNTLTDSLVQGRDLSSSHSDSVFWAILAFGIALTIGVVLLSGPIGAIFDDTRVSDLSSWLALLILLSAGSATQSALLHRNLQFRALSLVSLISVAIAGIAGVASALAGWGAWSLVVQLLVLKVVALLLLWRACEWRPRRSFSVQRLREVFGFGIGTLGLRLTKYAYDGSPRLFIGVVIGPAALGFYQAALRIYRICRTALVSPVSQVAMPVAARVQGDSALLARATEEATRFVAMVGIPCFIGLSLTAPEVLPLVFGDRWGEIGDDAAFSRETVIQVAQLVPLTGIATCTSTIGMSVLRGIGRSGWRLLLAIAQLSTALILLALIGRYGLNYVAIAMVATVYLQWPVKLFVMRNVAEIPIMPQLRALLTPLVASLAMAMAVTIWRQAVSESIGMVGLLASEILVGAVTYASVLAIIAREDLSRIIEVFRAARASRNVAS